MDKHPSYMNRHPTYTIGREAKWELIPPQMIGGVRRYIEHGIVPGHFLSAVFRNELVEAFNRADHYNAKLMQNYVTFLYNYCPSDCWGGKTEFDAWCEAGGLIGKGWKAPEDVTKTEDVY